MEGALGIEPRTCGLKVRCSTAELSARNGVARAGGIEPPCAVLETAAMPLSYARVGVTICAFVWIAGRDSNPHDQNQTLASYH